MPEPVSHFIGRDDRTVTLGAEDHNVSGGGMIPFELDRRWIGDRYEQYIAVDAHDGRHSISLGGGDDFIANSSGDDTIDGGSGFDMISFAAETFYSLSSWEFPLPYPEYNVSVNLTAGTARWQGPEVVDVHNEAIFEDGSIVGYQEFRFPLGRFGSFSHTLIGFEMVRATGGDDTITGSDADLEIFDAGAAGNDTVFGGGGFDVLSYGSVQGSVQVDLASGQVSKSAFYNFRNDTYTDRISGIEAVVGSYGADTLLGDSGQNSLFGAYGNDSLNGRGGRDTLMFSASFTARFDSDLTNRLEPTTGVIVNLSNGSASDGFGTTDTFANFEDVVGTALDDDITGDRGRNSLHGEAGNDTLSGGSGVDVLFGGADNDTLSGGGGVDRLDGDNGRDWLNGGADRDILNGGGGNDTLLGGSGDDVARGGSGGDLVKGDVGEDRIAGKQGGDRVFGGADNDRAWGDGGNDTVQGNGGNDSVFGGTGDDVVDGGAGRDFVYGGDGGDTLIGGGGGDRLFGGDGDDDERGGSGNDRFKASVGWDRYDGGAGRDEISFAGATGPVLVDLFGEAAVSPNFETDILKGIEVVDGSSFADDMRGDRFANTLYGHDGADSLVGRGGADLLDGSDGSDDLNGGGGNDTLAAGEGRDTLVGGAGHDTLSGGGGNDELFGGAGRDTFVMSPGRDRAFDFTLGVDILDVSSVNITNFAMLEASASGNGQATTIEFGGNTLTLGGLSLVRLDDVDVLYA